MQHKFSHLARVIHSCLQDRVSFSIYEGIHKCIRKEEGKLRGERGEVLNLPINKIQNYTEEFDVILLLISTYNQLLFCTIAA